jgi:hypothetical protein
MVINRTVYSSLAKFLEKKEICNTVIQGVSEIGALILTGNRTRQKEQPFHLSPCRKTMLNSKKKIGEIFH